MQIAIPPDSEAQARDFYGSLLGLREVPKPEPLAQRGGCWFVGPGIHQHLGVADDFQPARKAHPAFRVRDLAALRDRLTSSGIAVEDDDSLPGVRRSTPRTRSATGSSSSKMPTAASPTADEQRQEWGGARQTLGSARTLTVVGRNRRQPSLRARCASSVRLDLTLRPDDVRTSAIDRA